LVGLRLRLSPLLGQGLFNRALPELVKEPRSDTFSLPRSLWKFGVQLVNYCHSAVREAVRRNIGARSVVPKLGESWRVSEKHFVLRFIEPQVVNKQHWLSLGRLNNHFYLTAAPNVVLVAHIYLVAYLDFPQPLTFSLHVSVSHLAYHSVNSEAIPKRLVANRLLPVRQLLRLADKARGFEN
jgi:hypothetical protein